MMNKRIIKSDSKILVSIPERLGDALMTTPAVRYIKEQFPETYVTIITFSPVAQSVYKHNPWMDEHVFMPAGHQKKELGKRHDLLIHPHPDYDEKLAQGFDVPIYYPLDPIDCRHAFFELKFVASLCGLPKPEPVGYVFKCSPKEQEKFENWRKGLAVEANTRIVGIAPGCHRLAARGWCFWKPLTHERAWPVGHVEKLISRAHSDGRPWRFVLLGAGSETALTTKICKTLPYAIDMTGKTTGTEICALINQLDVVITMDSGLQHVACACKRPLIALHGPSNPDRTGPWPDLDLFKVLHHNPISEISVKQVYDVLLELICETPNTEII